MKLRLWLPTFALVAAVGVVATGCGSSATPSGASSQTTAPSPTLFGGAPAPAGGASAPGGGASLTIKSFSFSPNPLAAKVGDTVTVTNLDGTNHTVTAIDGSFDTGPFSGGSKTFRLTKAGTFNFHCNIHNFMTGVIQVSA